jgi:hypothetical protein
MKFLILFLVSFSALAGFPPTTLKGQSQSTATTTFNFQVPNNQATKTATGTLVETGSQNLLSNPGFEHSTVGTDWNVTNGTLTAASPSPFGSSYGVFTGSIANGNIQSLTGSGTAQAGLNCLVSAFVKTASSNVQLCAIHNGTLNTNLCVSVNPSNTWAQYQIPTVCDATSTVARVRITTSVSTTFHVDNVFVGVNPNFGSVTQAQLAGSSFFQSTASCDWATSSATLVALNATVACPGPTIITQSMGSWATTDSNLPIQTITNLPAGKYVAVFQGGASISANYGFGAINDGTTTCQGQHLSNATGTGPFTVACEFNYTSTQSSVSFQLYGMNAAGNTLTIQNSIATGVVQGLKFFLYYYPPSSSIVTTNNQDYDWTAYTATSPNSSFSTLTAMECFHKRQGSSLLINCKFSAASVAAAEARISLPTGLTIASSTIVPSIRPCGNAWRNNVSNPYATLCSNGLSYLTFALTSDYFTSTNANNLISGGQTFGFYAEVPIQGWNNNNVIVGTFENSFSTWSSPTTITLGGTTTAPTKGTTTQDQVICRRAGKDWFECDYIYKQTTGGTDGSGNYLFSLPTGYAFDTTSRYTPETTVSTVNGQTQSAAFELNGAISTTGGDNILQYGIIWDANRFRLRSSVGIIGVGIYNWSNANTNMRFTLRFKGTGPNN